MSRPSTSDLPSAQRQRRRGHGHRVIHDVYLAKVPSSSEVKEPWDYEQILSTIPAANAFRTPSSDCKLS